MSRFNISVFGSEEPQASTGAKGASGKKKTTAPSGRPLLGTIKHWHSCSGTGTQTGYFKILCLKLHTSNTMGLNYNTQNFKSVIYNLKY